MKLPKRGQSGPVKVRPKVRSLYPRNGSHGAQWTMRPGCSSSNNVTSSPPSTCPSLGPTSMRIHNDKSSKRRRLVRRRYRTAQNDGEGEQPLASPEAWRIRIFDVSRASPGRGEWRDSSGSGLQRSLYRIIISNVPFILSEYMIVNTSVCLGAVS